LNKIGGGWGVETQRKREREHGKYCRLTACKAKDLKSEGGGQMGRGGVHGEWSSILKR